MRKKAVTVKQIQDLDRIAIKKIGVPSLALMENAGCSVAQQVIKNLKNKQKPLVSVVCGLGNNAGDGFVIARHLINAGVNVELFLIGKGSRLKADAAVNYRILKNLKYPIKENFRVNRSFTNSIQKSHLVVDAIFGVGLNREILDPFKSVVEALNASKTKIIAVDVPSGLDGTTGKIYGTCVKASKTVTFSFAKQGFFKREGPRYCGKVIIVDIGIPKKLKDKI